MNAPVSIIGGVPFGVGFYTTPEAARLLKIPASSIRRWLGGYTYRRRGEERTVPPLWEPQLPRIDDRLELGFRDLVELRFVKAFTEAGVGLLTIRHCLDHARECAADDRPFSTRTFKTDGRTIFLESIARSGESETLDLRKRQYVLRTVVEGTFKDLDVEDEAVVRWRPFDGKPSIVIDPRRAFGQPIAAHSGVPTVVLAGAVTAEGSVERVAALFEVDASAVRDAVTFEQRLRAA